MGLRIQNARFFDTVSESEFGPECASDKEAEILAYEVERTMGINVRSLNEGSVLDELLLDLRSGALIARETHSSRACYCGSGKPWVSKIQQLGKPSSTRCECCSGTEQPELVLKATNSVEAPSSKIIDLFGALKRSLANGQAL